MKTLLTSFLLLISLAAPAQVIDDINKELGKIGSENNNSGNNNISFDGDLFWLELLLDVGFYPTMGLLFGFEDEPSPYEVDFARYPYEDGRNGIYLPLDEPGYPVRTQVTAHLQTNEDALYGGFLDLKFSPNRWLTLNVNRLQLFERLETGTDHFSITNFNAQFNRIRGRQFHLWWGGGLMLLDGEEALYGSASFNGGFTWFFKKPLSLYADTQLGFPNGVLARQHQVRIQVHLNRFMVYAGYQGLRVGSVRQPNWAVGTGMWF